METQALEYFTTSVPGDDHLWTSAFLNERFTKPLSTLGWTLIAPHFERIALQRPLMLLGAELQAGPYVKLWRGFAYTRVEIWQRIYKLFPEWLLPEDARRFFPDGDTSLRKDARRPVFGFHLIRNGFLVLWRDRAAASPIHNPRAWARFENELAAEIQNWQRRLDSSNTAAELIQLLLIAFAWTERLLSLHSWSLFYADVFYSLLRRVISNQLGQEQGLRILASLSVNVDTITKQVNRQIAALGAQVAADPELETALRNANSIDDLSAGEFREQVQEFLSHHGHRSFSLDIFDPPWAADFTGFAYLLLLTRKGRQSAVFQHESSTEHLPFVVHILWRLTKPYLRLRESQRYRWQEILSIQRQAILKFGNILVAAGRLRKRTDLFGLSWDEIVAAQIDQEAATARMEQLAKLRAASSTRYPAFLRGNAPLGGESFRLHEKTRLTGQGVSTGRVRGPARLMASPADLAKLRKGDILVTSSPDPAWTAVYESIVGLVSERGGQLSHGAVVAREYGLPAVFGLTGAMDVLRDGELIIVDGVHGVVECLLSTQANTEPA